MINSVAVIRVNGREYHPKTTPVVGVCLDGTDPAYLEAASGVMPNLQRMIRCGAAGQARSVVPSFTNPNNVAIATGVPPSVNGICGNYYYDAGRGEEVMMNDPAYLRCPTIFAEFSRAGQSVGVITTKDKLRLMLGHGLQGLCFSVEQGTVEVADLVGRPAPGIYDPGISVCCLEAGARLLERRRLDLLYLSTTDYVQHKHPPGSAEAQDFYARVDHALGEIDALGVVLAITADHGMNDKVNPDGSPKVQFLESLLVAAGFAEARVILPITDPYVVHHGALGSYATVYLGAYLDAAHVDRARRLLGGVAGVELVLERAEASQRFLLPEDRIGDLVVLSDRDTVLGRRPDWHDLSAVARGLRSHGGLHESVVPMIFNRPLKRAHAERLASGEARTYDLFDFAYNGTEG